MQVLQEKLGETRVHQALTEVAISSFDIKTNKPVIFTKSNVSQNNYSHDLYQEKCF